MYEKLQMQRLIARNMRRENSQLIIIQDREHLFTRMSFDKNITAISRSSSESGYSNISKRLNDIICEEKYEGEITISRSRIKDKNVKFMQESIIEPSSGKNVEKVNFKKEMLRSDMIIRKRIKDKRSISNLSGGFKNNLSKVRLSPHKEMQNISPFGHQ